MSLESDSIIDRRKLKRRLGLWRIVAILAVAAVVLVYFDRQGAVIPRDHVAQINVDGVITEDAARDRLIARIGDDATAKALIVAINSPGGTVVGGETLYKHLRDVAAKKPVVAVMGTLATSGGYMAALGADHIVAHGGTVTGSIGVILQSTDITGLLNKLGIEPEAIKSAPLKAVPNPLEPLTEEARAATKAVVLDMFEQFKAMVAERRNLSGPALAAVSDGRIFTGRQALELKLVDELGGMEEARQWLDSARKVPKSLPVRRIERRREDDDIFGIVSRILGKTLFSERLTLDGLVSVWHPEAK